MRLTLTLPAPISINSDPVDWVPDAFDAGTSAAADAADGGAGGSASGRGSYDTSNSSALGNSNSIANPIISANDVE